MKKDITDFQTAQVDRFTQHLADYTGAIPTFQIAYRGNSDVKQGIYLVDASHGFIRRLMDDGALTHLHEGVISVMWL